MVAFCSHGCGLNLSTISPLFRYVADHTSKHKQAQLGYHNKIFQPPFAVLALFRFPDDVKVSFVRHHPAVSIFCQSHFCKTHFKAYRQSFSPIGVIQFVSALLFAWLKGAEIQEKIR